MKRVIENQAFIDAQQVIFDRYAEYFQRPELNTNFSYVFEMRKCIIKQLYVKKEGKKYWTFERLGKMFNRNHASVINCLRSKPNKRVHLRVVDIFEHWIETEYYPVRFMKTTTKNGCVISQTTEFKLNKLN